MWINLELTLVPPRSKGFVKVFGLLMTKLAASWENGGHPDAGAQAKDALIQKLSMGATKEKSVISVCSPRKRTLIQGSHRVS